MNEGGTYAGHQVKNQETLGAPNQLQHAAEHEEGKHVEEDVHGIGVGVQKHVGKELVHPKVTGHGHMQPQKFFEGQSQGAVQYNAGQIKQHVDDQEILDHGG